MKRGERGITLIEIAVVLTIVAIMALFLTPALGEWVDNYRIRQTARDITSTLQEAKMKAISTNSQHDVTFDVANDTYQLLPGGDVTAVPRGVIINNTDLAGDTVGFRPNGTSTSSDVNDSIYITNTNGKQYRIRISPAGSIRIGEGWL